MKNFDHINSYDCVGGLTSIKNEETSRGIRQLFEQQQKLARQKGTPYEELDLGSPKWSDEELLDFMMVHPILINRPIVVTARGTRLCRPSEVVLEILVNPQFGAFTKEDGEVVINEKGERV